MEKKWDEMSVSERRESRYKSWYSPEGVEFKTPEDEASYRATVTRFKDILELKQPDRVPILTICTFMPSDLYGVTPYEVMNDGEKLASIFTQFVEDYKPDFYMSPALVGTSKVFEILDYKQYSWPGHGVEKEYGYQYNEGEYMKAEDSG